VEAGTSRAAAFRARPVTERERLVRRARLLARLGVAWHGIEAAVAIAAGVAAGSIALIGFGADSLIEGVAGMILLWRFASTRAENAWAEQRARRLISVTFFALAAYVGVESIRSLIGAHEPDASWIGIGLSAVTLSTMPPLARAKARVGERLGSAAAASESRQTMICAYLSAALLAGLVANAVAGWWWADPAAALVVAAVAVNEGRLTWRGDACCVPRGASADDAEHADCCH
jgi:divalent metal cation (Fe/Co/Zn/Cd) transporter